MEKAVWEAGFYDCLVQCMGVMACSMVDVMKQSIEDCLGHFGASLLRILSVELIKGFGGLYESRDLRSVLRGPQR